MPTLSLDFLRQEPDRALFLRPTLNYFFARLWFSHRPLFWEIFWALLSAEEPQVRLVAQVLPPGIAAGEARSVDDTEPLFSRMESGAAHSEDAVLHVLQAIRARVIVNDEVLVGVRGTRRTTCDARLLLGSGAVPFRAT